MSDEHTGLVTILGPHDSVPQEIRDVLHVSNWKVYKRLHRQEQTLVLDLQERHGSEGFVFDRESLVLLAKTILQSYQPTTEDEILATLRRIDARLKENE